jgi:pimeloyl-ACP methyl ester carboxylesterase
MRLLKKEELGPRHESYPALGRHGFTQVAYTEWGPRESERTVVCLHGLTRNGRDFDFLARHLAQRGMRVVAPDLPGRGRSAPLPHAHHYATPAYLYAMAGLLSRLNVAEVDWVGTSLGGHIGMELAARQAPIRRLVLNDFGARLQGAALNRLGRYSRMNRQFETLEELEQHLRTIYAPFGTLTDEQWRHMAEHSSVRDSEGRFRQNYDPGISQDFMLWPAMLDIVLWNVWERVDCEVLILRGESSDLLQDGTVQQMKKRGLAGSKGLVESVEIPDCGHAPSLMAIDQMRLIEKFLTREHPKSAAKRA